MSTLLLDRKTETLDLLARVHGTTADLAAEYPLVFGEDAPGKVIGIGDEHGLQSTCTILARDLVLPEGVVRAGLIGSVATDARWRGRGLATGVLVRAEAELVAQGCVLGLLWADDPEFYLRRGWSPVGREVNFRLEPRAIGALPRVSGVRLARAEDAPEIHALYERHPARVARSAGETAALLACPGMETLVVERAGELAGYACCGRGRDLRDSIHEWGGETSIVLSLARAHLERRFKADEGDAHGCLFLMAPAGEEKLAAALSAAGAARAEGILALGRILDAEGAAMLLARSLGADARVSVTAGTGGATFHIRGPTGQGELDIDGVLALLFGTLEVRPQVRAFLTRFGFSASALPLDPFAFGLDSI